MASSFWTIRMIKRTGLLFAFVMMPLWAVMLGAFQQGPDAEPASMSPTPAGPSSNETAARVEHPPVATVRDVPPASTVPAAKADRMWELSRKGPDCIHSRCSQVSPP